MTIIRPARLDPARAWETYADLVKQANANPELFGDFKHCQAMNRAYLKWQRLYNAMEAA